MLCHKQKYLPLSICLVVSNSIYSQESNILLSLSDIIDIYSLQSPAVRMELLNYENDILEFTNYQKSLLPSIAFTFNPVGLNRSLRLLQSPEDGGYSYVEDYSNTSSLGVSISQKVGFTGGNVNIGTNISYLNEFSRERSSFSTAPFYVSYSQTLWGGRKLFRMENKIRKTKNRAAAKKCCYKIAEIQLQAANLYLEALSNKLEADLTLNNMHANDTILRIGKIKLDNGYITEYDYKQIELQSLETEYVYRQALQKYDEALQNLKTYLEMDNHTLFSVCMPALELPDILDASLVKYWVCQNNPTLLEQEQKKLEAERLLFTAKLETHFNGNISLNYGLNQYADHFADAYRHANTQQSFTIGFQIPIWQWGINRNKRKIASNNYSVSLLAVEKSMREFDDDIAEYTKTYSHSIWLWRLSGKAYQLSCEQYRLAIKSFELGEISVYELTSARQKQYDTMQRYYSAIKEAYTSYFRLRSMALYDFKSGQNLEDIYLKNE